MIEVLTYNILPIFSMLALGFGLGRGGAVSDAEARAVNRVSFLVLQPALVFPLMVTADLSEFQLAPLASYALAEAATFAVAFVVARHVLGRELREAWLLGMATMFVNSLLYIWPISFLIYGSAAALPVTAIVIWDTAFFFAFFIVGMEVMADRGNPGQMTRRIVANPVLLAIALGAAVNLTGLGLPAPLMTALEFAGPAAPPMTLFALGVILSGTPMRPDATVASMTGLKLLGFPALVWVLVAVIAPGSDWSPLVVLTAAGPSGAMPFALALLYGVRTDAIAPVIVWTSILSLFSLAALA